MCMKTVILAGGLGTRISEESHLKPKPMIEIGKYPILVHIMRIYATQGFNDFVVCAGYFPFRIVFCLSLSRIECKLFQSVHINKALTPDYCVRNTIKVSADKFPRQPRN